MSISRIAAEKFGGIVAYRVLGGEHGIYAVGHAGLWELTRSASAEELRAKLERMRPVEVQFRARDVAYTSNALSVEDARRAAMNGARKRRARSWKAVAA